MIGSLDSLVELDGEVIELTIPDRTGDDGHEVVVVSSSLGVDLTVDEAPVILGRINILRIQTIGNIEGSGSNERTFGFPVDERESAIQLGARSINLPYGDKSETVENTGGDKCEALELGVQIELKLALGSILNICELESAFLGIPDSGHCATILEDRLNGLAGSFILAGVLNPLVVLHVGFPVVASSTSLTGRASRAGRAGRASRASRAGRAGSTGSTVFTLSLKLSLLAVLEPIVVVTDLLDLPNVSILSVSALCTVVNLVRFTVAQDNLNTAVTVREGLDVGDERSGLDVILQTFDLFGQFFKVTLELVNLGGEIFGTSSQKCSTCDGAHNCESKDFFHTLIV